jgi:hypothetical protein
MTAATEKTYEPQARPQEVIQAEIDALVVKIERGLATNNRNASPHLVKRARELIAMAKRKE